MRKWIACVEHINGHISTLRVSNGSAWADMSRHVVAFEITSGQHEYVTWYKDPKTGNWTNGSKVNVIDMNGKSYLRTDENKIAADNLGSLNSLDSCPFAVGPHKNS